MSRHRVALIGLGMAVTPHAKSLLDLADRVEVAAGHEPDAARRDAFARPLPVPACDSLEPILADRSIDAVAVLTPPNTHLEIAPQLAPQPASTCCSRSRSTSPPRGPEQLVAACREAGVTLGVVLQHRFKPAAERLARILRDGRARRHRRLLDQPSGCGGRRATTTSPVAAPGRATAAACCSRRASTRSI